MWSTKKKLPFIITSAKVPGGYAGPKSSAGISNKGHKLYHKQEGEIIVKQ
jgi:hypothetical protein